MTYDEWKTTDTNDEEPALDASEDAPAPPSGAPLRGYCRCVVIPLAAPEATVEDLDPAGS